MGAPGRRGSRVADLLAILLAGLAAWWFAPGGPEPGARRSTPRPSPAKPPEREVPIAPAPPIAVPPEEDASAATGSRGT